MIEKQDKTSKQTSTHQTNQSGRSKRSLHESQGEPRGERDVIRLRNPTEDKRAFRRMLTSADLPKIYLGPFLKPSRRDYVNIDVIIATSFDSHVFQKFAFFLKIGFISIFAY